MSVQNLMVIISRTSQSDSISPSTQDPRFLHYRNLCVPLRSFSTRTVLQSWFRKCKRPNV